MKVNLVKGDKISTKTDYRDALPVNMYPVKRDILGDEGYMLCYPGLTSLGTGVGKDRAGNYNDRFTTHFRVSGSSLIDVAGDGTVTNLGTITGTNQSSMPYSFITQAVIADKKMWLYTPDPTSKYYGLEQVTDSDLGDPIDGVWVDGYYFLTDGEYIYHTRLTSVLATTAYPDPLGPTGPDPTNNPEFEIDPLQFATAEFMPDPSLGVAKTQDNKIIVFGRYTIEYFINEANDDFAFTRVATRAQKIGIVATHAKCEVGGRFYFTGGRKKESLGVYILGVGSSEKVSTREVDKLLAAYTEQDLVDMRMESRMEDDTTFVLIHLPNETLCFNETIAKNFGLDIAWSILKTDIVGDSPYRGINGVFDSNSGNWVYGDKRDANIGTLDNTVFTHYGNMVEWLLYSPLLRLEKTSIDEIVLETIPGHTTSDDANVAISLTYNGLTYGKEWWELYGDPLDYNKRFIIRRLGYVPDFVGFKLRGATTSRMAFGALDIKYA